MVIRADIGRYWVIGNHDLRSVSKNQWKSSLGINYLHRKIEIGDYDIFIVDSNFTAEDSDVKPGKDYNRGNVSEDELEWLEKELKKSSKKKIVFMHHPPLSGTPSVPSSNALRNASAVQKILSENDVIAVFSGHTEDFYRKKIGGVEYFIFPGMTKNPKYQGNFLEITLKKRGVSAGMYYLEPGSETEYNKIKIK